MKPLALQSVALTLALGLCQTGCGGSEQGGIPGGPDDASNPAQPVPSGTMDPPPSGSQPDPDPVECGFDYDAQFAVSATDERADASARGRHDRSLLHGQEASAPMTSHGAPKAVVHAEPEPPFVFKTGSWQSLDGVTLPGYDDDMPLFERATEWEQSTRCYETPVGSSLLTEAQAYEQYVAMAELTTGRAVDRSEGARTVVGIRGAYPGTFNWHGNRPNQFNDTLALLWMEDGKPHVREFPVNTDTGSVYFGFESASSLRPNRHYRYKNGWHRKYNAPQMAEWAYRVADDSNGNGHWDRERNGWLDGGKKDYERAGGAHNIHMASVNGPLGKAKVNKWSAGCQVIPGMENWLSFLEQTWTGSGDIVDYFLLDARDIDHRVWGSCEPDGSHACPYRIDDFPFVVTGDTSKNGVSEFDRYNCSTADESGPELVYVFNVQQEGRLKVEVECDEPVDIDIHLLDGDDENACLARDHQALSYDLSPGRYFIVADTWVDGDVAKKGAFELTVRFE